MSEGRIDDEMIEISDPDQEPAVVEPPPKVIIEYRERGVPWMLIPPMVMICVVGAVMGYRKLAPTVPTTTSTPPGLLAQNPVEVSNWDLLRSPETTPEASGKFPNAETLKIEPPKGVEGPASVKLPPVTPEKPVEPVTTVVEIPPVVAPVPVVEKPAEPPTFHQVSGVGFDPKALEAEKKEAAPPADPAIAPAARPDEPRQPARPAVVDERNLPTEVDEELLPPDPRLAKARGQQRAAEREAEALTQVEADRKRFHSDLREICRISRTDYLEEVKKLSDDYGMQVDPKIKKKAVELLGNTGRYAGVDRPTRIDVLRAVGFPEPLILEDVFTNYEVMKIGERNGPRNESEAMHRSILYLLRYAPGQRAAAAKSAATRPTPPPPSPAPAVLSNPNRR